MEDLSEGQELELKRLNEKRQEIDPLNLVGGISSAFDLISSEYGWRDEDIHNLTLARMQQVVSAIQLRKMGEQRKEKIHLSWAVRMLATYIAAGYMTEENTAIEGATKITLDEIEHEILETVSSKPSEPKEGSFERLSQAFSQLRG